MDNLLLQLFPTCCIFCSRLGPMICEKCAYLCEVIYTPICMICGEESMDGFTHEACLKPLSPTQLHSCFSYEGYVKKSIEISKEAPFEYGAIQDLSRHGVRHALDVGYFLFDFEIVPVPLDRKTLRRRGFNQAKLISDVVSFFLELPVDVRYLYKEISGFVANPEGVAGKKILLVDDVYKTGNTLKDCSKVLYAAGAAEVRCFTLSRVL